MIKNNNTIALGSLIRRRRKQLRLTQRQLAEFSACGEAFLHLLEHGKASVRFDKLLDVLKILGLQLNVEEGKDLLTIDARLK